MPLRRSLAETTGFTGILDVKRLTPSPDEARFVTADG
jgi:hypothetical protein